MTTNNSSTIHQKAENLDVILRRFFEGHPVVVAVYLFGSQAKGTAGPTSDVDVAILLDDAFNLQAHPMFRLELTAKLERYLKTPVDLLILNQANLVLRNQVLKYGRLLFEHDHRQRVAFEVRSRQDYFDFKPMLDVLHKKLTQQIQEEGLERRYRGDHDPISEARRARERFERATTDHVRGVPQE